MRFLVISIRFRDNEHDCDKQDLQGQRPRPASALQDVKQRVIKDTNRLKELRADTGWRTPQV